MNFFESKHSILAGLGRRGAALARDFHRRGSRLTVIEQSPSSGDQALCKRLGCHLVIGNAASPETLHDAGIERAQVVVAICGEDNTNIEVALQAHKLRESVRGAGAAALQCHVHVYDSRLKEALRRFGMERLHSGVRLHYFNVYEQTARHLAWRYPLHDDRLTEPDLQEHFIIVGFGHFGQQVVLWFLRLGHLANGKQPRFTIIDKVATQNSRRFLRQYPGVEKLCQLDFLDCTTTDPEVLDLSFLQAQNPSVRETPVICFDNDPLCFASAMDLLPACARRLIPSIWTRLADQQGVSRLFASAGDDLQLSRIRPFGALHEVLRADAFLNDSPDDRFAQKRHEAYCAQQEAEGIVSEQNSSIQSWDELSEDLRNSNREQADHVHVKLRTLGYRIELAGQVNRTDPPSDFSPTDNEIEILARMEHDRWMAGKILAGWSHDELGNRRLKLHDNLVPYDRLPEAAKEKDRDTVRGLAENLAASGFRIVRD